jgi:hypothetical protein
MYKSREMNDYNNKALADSVNLIYNKMAEIEKKTDETLKREIENLKKKVEEGKKNTNEQDLQVRIAELERVTSILLRTSRGKYRRRIAIPKKQNDSRNSSTIWKIGTNSSKRRPVTSNSVNINSKRNFSNTKRQRPTSTAHSTNTKIYKKKW